MKRTNYAGSLTEADLGRPITVAGWVLARRDMGGVEDAYQEVMRRLMGDK